MNAIDPMVFCLPVVNKSGEWVGQTLIDGDQPELCVITWRRHSAGYIKANRAYLHRMAQGLDTGDSRVVDHLNHDKTDNRRANLSVVANNGVNTQNRRGPTRHNQSSGVRGVYWFKPLQKWHAKCTLRGVQHHLGYFDTIDEANKVVTAKRKELGFQGATLNG